MVLVGCSDIVPRPEPEETASYDFGPEPVTYKDIIKEYNLNEYKYFDSLIYDWISPPEEGWVKVGYYHDPIFGWKVCVSINTKNSMGRYEGFKTDLYILENNAVKRHYPSGDVAYTNLAKAVCKQ